MTVVALAAALAVVAGVLTPSVRSGALAATPVAGTWAAPAGSGTACTRTSPCDLPTALAAAAPGSTVWLLSGNYRQVVVSKSKATVAAPITVRRAPGNHATFDRLRTSVPNVNWRGMRIETTMYLTPGASNTTIRRVHFAGAGLFVRADRVVVTRSLFENGKSIDGIQIGRANGVIVRYSTVRNYNQNGTSGYHSDCVQVFDSKNISIHHNSLSGCYNSEIIFSRGAGLGISHVRITANFIRGCLVKSAACRGGTGIDLREPTASDVVVKNNTFAKSSVRLGAIPGLVFDRNIIGYLSICDGTITNSVVLQSSPGCVRAATDAAAGTRMATVGFRDLKTGDLHLTHPNSAKITPVGGTPNPTGYDDRPLPADVAGAVAG